MRERATDESARPHDEDGLGCRVWRDRNGGLSLDSGVVHRAGSGARQLLELAVPTFRCHMDLALPLDVRAGGSTLVFPTHPCTGAVVRRVSTRDRRRRLDLFHRVSDCLRPTVSRRTTGLLRPPADFG